jgi:predicted secreted Zn-dependent protease
VTSGIPNAILARMRARRLVASAVLAAALGCAAPSVLEYKHRGGIEVNDQVEFYDIRGKTLRELRIDARVKGPVARDTSFLAVTHSSIHWSYSYSRQPSLCRLTNVRTVVDAIVTLPRWVDSSDVDPAALRWWIDSSERVRTHEAEHLQIAVDAAAEIHSLLMRKTSGDCNLLRQSVNDEAGVVLAREREQQLELDRRTRHGTVLPAAR